MRTGTFYLIRSEHTYEAPEPSTPTKYKSPDSALQAPIDAVRDAEKAALELANRNVKAYGVYEVRLVGIAQPPAAVYTPIISLKDSLTGLVPISEPLEDCRIQNDVAEVEVAKPRTVDVSTYPRYSR